MCEIYESVVSRPYCIPGTRSAAEWLSCHFWENTGNKRGDPKKWIYTFSPSEWALTQTYRALNQSEWSSLKLSGRSLKVSGAHSNFDFPPLMAKKSGSHSTLRPINSRRKYPIWNLIHNIDQNFGLYKCYGSETRKRSRSSCWLIF